MRERGPCDDHAILVVDDDEAIRWLLREILSTEGYAVRVAANGQEALAILSGGVRPCLILLDLDMPIMDGWQFCAVHQQRTDLAAVPLAIMSAAHDLRVEQPPCRPAAIFPKPFDLDQLLRRVHTLVS